MAAPDLSASLANTATTSRRAPRLRRALLRYRIRMATRPTPFGLFAGIGVGSWGEVTDLALAADRPVSARLDMAWLTGYVRALEERPEIRHRQRLVANSCAVVRDGRVFVADPGTAGWTPPADVSLRATPAVTAALALARRPVPFDELVGGLLARPRATVDRVTALLDDLWRQGLLVTDLAPPLTADPVASVAGRLRSAGAEAEAADGDADEDEDGALGEAWSCPSAPPELW